MTRPPSGNARHVTLGTISFAVCFAAWGLISAFAPRFRELFSLTATQTAFLVAVPVLLGSIGRVPVGILADRFGSRLVFSVLMIVAAIPAWLVPAADSYQSLLVIALFMGIAGASFPVGVGYVSRWTPPERQGSALGVYGLGNIGQSAAVFLGPVLAAAVGWQPVYRGMAVLLAVWGIAFGLLARDAPFAAPPKGLGHMMRVLTRERLSWVLALFYFLTFGGFIAFSIYLPTLLKDEFRLSPADAGLRTAGFVALATLLRPVGGWLSDRVGGARVLSGVFFGVIPFALLLTWPAMIPFTMGVSGCAALLGLGNGAVFKLVPQYFPAETGTVTGLVGALGGLGGFLPPLLLGFFRDRLGAIWPGFVLLAGMAFLLWWVNQRVFVPRQEALETSLPPARTRTMDRLRASAWATFWTALLVASIVVSSRNLQNFDPALVVYTFATIFATWGVAYHCVVWLQKPPTRIYWRRSWQLAWQRGVLRSLRQLLPTAWTHLAAQTFIHRRSAQRWWMHQLLFWGCLLAVVITFPLVFGWIHLGSAPDDQMTYVVYLFGFPAGSFRIRTVMSWILFHGLDIASVLVLGGIALALWQRMRDRGAEAVQDFGRDFFPLILLFAISVTGLALTVSNLWLSGNFYGFLAILHAITVIAALLYLPFGKLFHILQRPAQLGVKLYHRVGDEGQGACCARCGERFASRMHVDDLKVATRQLGFDYSLPGPPRSGGNWLELCPACKRKTIASAQLRLKDRDLDAAASIYDFEDQEAEPWLNAPFPPRR